MREKRLRIAASAEIGMHAHRGHLGVIARRHALARDRGKTAVDADAEEAAELMRARAEWPRPRELDQRAHLRRVVVARRTISGIGPSNSVGAPIICSPNAAITISSGPEGITGSGVNSTAG